VRIETGGGGGWGHPFDRESERVLADVCGGFVSRASAEEHYGVVLAGDGSAWISRQQSRAGRGDRRPSSFTVTATTRRSIDGHAAIAKGPRHCRRRHGGTFTDITLLDPATGRVWSAKTPSTPDDPRAASATASPRCCTPRASPAPMSPACCTARR
jgi:hypothetical protein